MCAIGSKSGTRSKLYTYCRFRISHPGHCPIHIARVPDCTQNRHCYRHSASSLNPCTAPTPDLTRRNQALLREFKTCSALVIYLRFKVRNGRDGPPPRLAAFGHSENLQSEVSRIHVKFTQLAEKRIRLMQQLYLCNY